MSTLYNTFRTPFCFDNYSNAREPTKNVALARWLHGWMGGNASVGGMHAWYAKICFFLLNKKDPKMNKQEKQKKRFEQKQMHMNASDDDAIQKNVQTRIGIKKEAVGNYTTLLAISMDRSGGGVVTSPPKKNIHSAFDSEQLSQS